MGTSKSAPTSVASSAAPGVSPEPPPPGAHPVGRQLLLALTTGVLLGLSQPLVIEALADEPVDRSGLTGLLALVGFVPILLALRGTGPKRAYWLGFLASFVQFTINLQWLVVAMVVFGRIPLVVSWLILSVLTAAMAAYVAAAYAITRVLAGRLTLRGYPLPMWLVFPVALTAVETLRNFGPLGGFPWANVGTSFSTVPLFAQAAALAGVHGLVLLAALVGAALAEVIARRRQRRAPLITVLAVLIAWVGFGAARLAGEPTGGPTVKVALLQGNIEQGIRNHEAWTGRKILERYHTLTDEALAKGAELVVWPEAAFPLRLRRDLKTLEEARVVAPGHAMPKAAVIGAVAYEPVTVNGKRTEARHNSAFVLGPELKVEARVDKKHLVPFGEYVPWPFGAIVRQLVPIGGTVPGEVWRAVPVRYTDDRGQARELSLGVTICYEGVFPEISRALKNAGATLHVNVTNDGWYGISGAPTQHLLFYALRAIESGMPVVRAANTGKSGWVDTRGRLHDVTAIYTDRAVVAEVPLANSWTLYALLGEWLSLPCVLAVLLAWLYAILGRDVLARARPRLDNVLGAVGLLLATAGAGYFLLVPGVMGDEGNATRALLTVLAGLLVGVGALSGRPWGRKAQLTVGVLAAVVGVLAAPLGAPWMLIATAAGVALFVAQRKRAAAYTRAMAPLAFDDGAPSPLAADAP
ncbi:MAG: apolipoprotein N-acyltransferase [Deltaproteobacteria bacterium]|nr:apolipoprotein N-acyltransferase [Deltaproteobacteria bacterium]